MPSFTHKSFLISILLFGMVLPLSAQEDLKVIQSHWVNYTDGHNALYKHLSQQAMTLLDEREEKINAINSLQGWKERQAFIKTTLNEVLGPFPEKTPLQPEITRKVDKGEFTMEHIVLQSQPGFYMSSTLFIPKNLDGPAPTIIYCSGHALEAYRSFTYQHVILNLVKKGYVVFAFDPVGQGERLEYYDPETLKPTIGGPTKQHSYPGAQGFIVGSTQAMHMIWDGVRAVDYLLTRKEVDPDRIGITGRSGGGTQSSYIAAVDERIYAAAPENYITNFRRLMLTHGPQDAEQNFMRGIKKGLDHPDLLLVRAPKPNMMITTSRDIFNIQGARETASEVQGVYQAYSAENNFLMVEDDMGHGSTLKNREAMYAFFNTHLSHKGTVKDQDIDTLSKEDLQVTAKGQVLSSYTDAKRIFDLNKERLEHLDPQMELDLAKVKELAGYRAPEKEAETFLVGWHQRDGYVIEKHLMQGEGGYWFPFLLFRPEQKSGKALLYLDPEDKALDAGVEGPMDQLVKEGHMVLAPDLLNIGEMGKSDFKGDANFEGFSYNLWFGAMLIGRSIVGIQAGDVSRLVDNLHHKEKMEMVAGLGKGQMSSVLLHAANFDKRIKKVAFVAPMTSFKSVVEDFNYSPMDVSFTVAGSLGNYDLPQLMENLKERNPLVFGEGSLVKEFPSLEPERIKATGSEEAADVSLLEWMRE
ncbi:alpha/beta hydrolase family protein [Pleomorphovibrio marinus]|uniref:alpha/beta hydrolase family protein n=1 Tax=Pleomorphovibrio marinus TaxID=2164132 RepID=UPI000E0C479F|nr:acetylxylan esterase [Pleomorphovibrio marinus]